MASGWSCVFPGLFVPAVHAADWVITNGNEHTGLTLSVLLDNDGVASMLSFNSNGGIRSAFCIEYGIFARWVNMGCASKVAFMLAYMQASLIRG